MNQASSNLCSVVISNGAVLPATLAKNIVVYITNYYVFDAEDFSANILKDWHNDRVIHILFQFSQWEYPWRPSATARCMTISRCRPV